MERDTLTLRCGDKTMTIGQFNLLNEEVFMQTARDLLREFIRDMRRR